MLLLEVGTIVNTHGIKGEVRVKSMTDDAESRYQTGNVLTVILKDGSQRQLTVNSHRLHKSFNLLTFKEVHSIDEAEILVGGTLFIDSEDLVDVTAEKEHYIYQLVGMEVQNEEGQKIGKLKEVLHYPANDVWVIARSDKQDLLVPAIEDVIRQVDYDEKVIKIHVMEGLDVDED